MQRDIVFSAEWDDRTAEVRRDPAAIAALRSNPTTRVLPMWRGRPLIAGAARTKAGWVAPGHKILDDARDDWVFLGHHEGAARFAADVSSWVPDSLEEAAMAAFFDPVDYYHPAVPSDYAFLELRGLMVSLSATDAAMASTARALMNWHQSHRYCASCGQPSVVTQSGWQRRCPACKASHFPRTDPVVIMLVLRGNKVLLGRSPGWPEGMYSTLAGFVEPGEALEGAVRREVHEETGITVRAVRYVGGQPWSWPNSLMLGFVAVAEDDEITLDPVELEDAIWVTREDMVDVLAGLHPTVRRPRAGAIAYELITRWLSGALD
ncbi:NAD(+) diphosphatase [Pararhodobacter sp.]|uniref:NAD(+) diphosphatase n=1 Tax=Pararhodobacter sp. TaxID=2127056 RepID=UPI002AFDD6B7|nr:NAD(+) diphosphatase [Pararhodobacter sp.]